MPSTHHIPGGSPHERLLFLHERFHHRLPDRLAAIGSALGTAASGSFEELARLFHQLAGSAGTYGLEALTLIAREGEALCHDETRPRAERISALHEVVQAMRVAAGLTGGSAPS